jgi:hypothetical protein
MKPEKAFEAVDALVDGMDAGERASFFDHLRTTYPTEIGATAINGGETSAQATALELTPEQQEKATATAAALAERFDVSAEDFSVLRTSGEDGDTLTVVYTAGNGIDLGDSDKDYDTARSWDAIFGEDADERFVVEVDGKAVDSRRGMTREVYDAFIQDARDKGIDPLPDSPQLSDQNGDIWTDTWLTGEDADRRGAPIAYVLGDGDVHSGVNPRVRDARREHRFRPAVVIE